jgi:hypothetical protein
VDSIVISDAGGLSQLDASWAALRRHGARVDLATPDLGEAERVELERELNSALDDCGCDQGAIGVAAFSVLTAFGLALNGRRSNRTSSPLALVARAVPRIGLAAALGAVVGKAIGLLAAALRFGRHRRRLHAVFGVELQKASR